ncbi:MAG: nickel pincer cofactor biosynthesis protein LarB [candidate division Zixibacteria bacterium]|nr:nickel pincer cofactor biosynthesis protein LarB [candidate division Zixibacteria bacterium]
MTTKERLKKILLEVESGALKINMAAELIEELNLEDIGFARIDHLRESRCGFPEVIFAAGKEPEQVIAIAEKIIERKGPLFITRIDETMFRALKKKLPRLSYNKQARTASLLGKVPRRDSGILIITAGTSDIGVAEEAATTCEALGYLPERLYDVGVAGIHRVLAESEKLRAAKVIIVAAGMEGALASVVGGLVDAPVIAVPTSVGYGASFGGVAALLAMLNSCASGVTVVNIDNGFGAAVAAIRILKAEGNK